MAEVDYFMAAFFGPSIKDLVAGGHLPRPLPKPRVRPIYTEGRHPWLCVGGGCYSYGDTAGQAYHLWRRRLTERRREDRVLWGKHK